MTTTGTPTGSPSGPPPGAPTGVPMVWERLRRARAEAFGEDFVGQESFVTAGEVLDLGRRAGVGPGTSVLDVCCGSGGPGLFLVKELGCDYLGVDRSASSVESARAQATAHGLPARVVVGRVPPLPAGPFDVVLLLETLLAFRDKPTLFRAVADAVRPGGRFVLTAEVGRPLSPVERARLPVGDDVWLGPLTDLVAGLGRVGLRVSWLRETTIEHASAVRSLLSAYTAVADECGVGTGAEAVEHLLLTHRRWARWLDTGRVRTIALVAERVP